MQIKHIKTERTDTSVTYTLEVEGAIKTVSGQRDWSLDAAMEHFPRRREFAKAFAKAIKDETNFIGQSYRDHFGQAADA